MSNEPETSAGKASGRAESSRRLVADKVRFELGNLK
jgi:hypothetical protein